MRVEIIEVDRDYNTVASSTIRKFKSLSEAEKYCEKEKWSGVYYIVGWYESRDYGDRLDENSRY